MLNSGKSVGTLKPKQKWKMKDLCKKMIIFFYFFLLYIIQVGWRNTPNFCHVKHPSVYYLMIVAFSSCFPENKDADDLCIQIWGNDFNTQIYSSSFCFIFSCDIVCLCVPSYLIPPFVPLSRKCRWSKLSHLKILS